MSSAAPTEPMWREGHPVVAEFTDDPAAPVFFMSYWRPKRPSRFAGPPREPTVYVRRFFDDLTADVNDLIGAVPGRDPGFLDVAGSGGTQWRHKLLRAVGTCQVFVCLLSRPYLTSSPWCAREWDAFTRRRVVPRTPDADPVQTALVPVLWTPVRDRLPRIVSEVDLFVPTGLPPEFAALYLEDGLLGLLKTGQDRVYQAIVWKLALHVEWIRSSYWVESAVLDNADDLRTTFDRAEG
jgi:TIR domain-containing protein